MNILLISGHGAGDIGAIGVDGIRERDLTREMTINIKSYLDKYCNVDIYPQDRNAYKDVVNGNVAVNASKYDYVFEIHFNAFNGNAYGSEVYVTSREEGITEEQEIMKAMSKYYRLRDNDKIFDGVKVTDFAVINYFKRKGVSSSLLETCFIDNKNDMNIYNDNKKTIAEDIVKSLVKGFGLDENDHNKPITPPTMKSSDVIADEVIKGYWGVGENRKTMLTNAGYDYNVIQQIVNEKLSGTTSKSLRTWAIEVINGKYGNGKARKNNLNKNGCPYSYEQVQAEVNRILS